MAKIPESEIERLKTEISLERLVEGAGVKLKKRGGDRIGHCPFHDDKTPSFVVSPGKNLWNCLGACGEGGDVISFVMKIEGVSFRHGVELLRDGYAPHQDKPVKPVKKATTPKLDTFERDKDDAAMLARVCDYYHTALKDNAEGLKYLEKRGLAHPELIETFKLGLSNRTLGYRLPEKNRKAGAQVRGQLQKLGIYRNSGHEHLAGSLVIPMLDMPTGAVRQMYGRKIVDNLRKGTPKHLYLPGPMAGVWNESAFKAADEMILCESLIDAMTFWCAGYRNVTSAYGINGFTDAILAAFKTYGVKRVLIAYDRDAAGDKAAKKLVEALNAENIETYRILFPKGMDANSYALQVTPAPESLGVLIRSAEWTGTGIRSARPQVKAERIPVPIPPLAAKKRVEEKKEEPEESAELEPPEAVRVPKPPAETDAAISEHEIIFSFGDRRWRVRGLARNTSYETLRINLLVSREVNGADMFHVDTLDLYGARHRAGYVAQAASELGLSKDSVKGDLARILLKLEGLQEAQIEEALAPQENLYEMTEDEIAQGTAFLEGPDLLGQITRDAHACGIVGEDGNLVTAYLACISRKLEKPLAVLIQSTSAAGKSALMDAVLAFVPEEEQVAYAAMTGQALFYLGETALKRKVLAIAEEEGARDAGYALKRLQSQGDLSMASTGKDPVTGKLVTQEYKVEGPMALMMTTTAIDLDEELKNRCLVLTVNEGQAQTRAIHERQRFEETLEGLLARRTKSNILAKHQNAQRLLRPLAVVNPYARHLTFLSDKTRMRRDHRKYLGLIRAIALLHQHQRPIKSAPGPSGEPIEYVEATLADIEAAGKLANDVLGRTLDELAPQTRTLLGLIMDMVRGHCEQASLKQSDYRFTRREVREHTGWGLTQLKVHLKRLEELEYLLPHLGGRGRSYVYELAYNSEGDAGQPFVMGLIDVENLRQKQRYDVKKSGQNGKKSPPSRPQVGGVSGGCRGVVGVEKPALPHRKSPKIHQIRPKTHIGV
ncbi:MAG: CHC2 zinc finger domain-containing protein [Robiginitomaculum sp.]|nr:CHC2 zinc finger domain-containing protein [Robiginitomaculum sp.]